MGQARQRGTFEERQSLAIQNAKLRKEAAEEYKRLEATAQAKREAAMSSEEREQLTRRRLEATAVSSLLAGIIHRRRLS